MLAARAKCDGQITPPQGKMRAGRAPHLTACPDWDLAYELADVALDALSPEGDKYHVAETAA
jgi:hypothetical protein